MLDLGIYITVAKCSNLNYFSFFFNLLYNVFQKYTKLVLHNGTFNFLIRCSIEFINFFSIIHELSCVFFKVLYVTFFYFFLVDRIDLLLTNKSEPFLLNLNDDKDIVIFSMY